LNHVAVRLITEPVFAEILVAEMAEIGYDSFVETDGGLEAFIPETGFSKEKLSLILDKYRSQTHIQTTFSTLEKVNWNEEWEKNYPPVLLEEKVMIRASFHEPLPVLYDIVINPKMSFGTGHHDTTALMIENQLTVSHLQKKVLDVGCGTGILGIMALKLGATSVKALDVEEWAVENTRENAILNHCENLEVKQGTLQEVNFAGNFDIILANINRNILLAELADYASRLMPGGFLLLSGFYMADTGDLLAGTVASGLAERKMTFRNQWASLVLQKNK
jgi:ribosomal protein L11 methyltransferase